MSKKAGISKWYESVLKLLDGTIAYQEYEVLESKLLDNPSAFDEYLEFIIIYSCMHEPLGLFDNILTFDPSEEPTVDMGVLEKLAEYEKNVKTVEVERVKKPADRVLTEEERQAKIRAFLAEERKIEEQEQLSDELERRKIRRREQRRRQRAQRAQLIAAKVRGYLRSAAIAAILMVIGYLVYAVMHPPEPASVATLTNGADVKWADSRQPAEPDSPLGPGPMKLVEGYARITFNEGAGIVLEAPAEINLKNSNRAFLQLGKLSAEVPVQARGFKIDTPSASIIDLGTEFGVHVKEDGSSDIHVFKGKVSLLAGKLENMIGKLFGTVEQIVEAGQARRVKVGSSNIEGIQFGQKVFARNIPTSSYEQAVIKNDPVIYYRFNEPEEIVNDSVERRGKIEIVTSDLKLGDDYINRCVLMEGSDSYIAINLPYQKTVHKTFTLSFWMWYFVQMDGDDDEFTIFSTKMDSQGNESSTFVGGIENIPTYNFNMVDERGRGLNIPNDDIVCSEALKSRTWFHITISFGQEGIIRILINGNEAGSLSIGPGKFPMAWDRIYLNISYDEINDEIEDAGEQNLLIDELAIFDRALSTEEIRQMYLSAGQ